VFKKVSTTIDDFSSVACFPSLMIINIPVMDMELKENDLISFMNPACPQCSSKGVSRNGTSMRKLENGMVFRMHDALGKMSVNEIIFELSKMKMIVEKRIV